MSRHEASWHEHLAGMRAAEAARQQGGNPAAIAAVATATAGPTEIGGFLLAPATEGTIWTLQRLAREFRSWADALGMQPSADGAEPGTREMLELGLSTLAFCDARATWKAMECGELESLIVRADAMIWETPVEILTKLETHFRREMQRIRNLTPAAEDAPGKQETAGGANGNSPAMPTPQEAAD